jgi:hypothetical protein
VVDVDARSTRNAMACVGTPDPHQNIVIAGEIGRDVALALTSEPSTNENIDTADIGRRIKPETGRNTHEIVTGIGPPDINADICVRLEEFDITLILDGICCGKNVLTHRGDQPAFLRVSTSELFGRGVEMHVSDMKLGVSAKMLQLLPRLDVIDRSVYQR